MKDNEWVNQVVDDLQTLPEPDYEKDFDINKQNNIHDNLMKFSRSFELKKRRRDLMNRITAGVASIAALILFCVIFIPISGDSDNAIVPEIGTFKEYFHQKMEEMHKQEKNYSYTLIHTELNAVQKDDAIAVFKENNNNGEQIYIAYFEKQDNQWEWKQTRGAGGDSRINWSSMNQRPYIYSGVLSDNSIIEVYAGEEQAKIITIEGDKRFWYAISPLKEVEVMIVTENGHKKILKEVKALEGDQPSVPTKEWKDVSTTEDLVAPDFPTNVKDYIANTLMHWTAEPDENLIQEGYPPEYDHYMQSFGILSVVDEYIRVEGVDLEKDFYKLQMLAAVIQHEQYERTKHINFNPEDPNRDSFESTREAVRHWKPASERYHQAEQYITELLNDINVVVNGVGEPFGVSEQLNGDKVDELDSFLKVDEAETKEILKHL
nr:hypothetical protein [Fredinandcohnia onubensis]